MDPSLTAGFGKSKNRSEIFKSFRGYRRFTRYGIGFLTIFFLLLLLPILPKVSTFHSDETFYTDAAIQMLKTGDYISPYYPNGSLRSNKPILTYWIIVIGYKLFGMNYFGSRIGFLIAGCLVIVITYKTSLTLFQHRMDALLSVILLIANILLFEISLRSTPDILQCLFSSISLYGFINLIFGRSRLTRHYLMAYFGAALSIETKGFLGIFPVLYAFLFCLLYKSSGVKLRDLIHLRIMTGALVVAALWYGALYMKHGETAFQGFINDQVGSRFTGSKFYILYNLRDYLLALMKHFLPWTIFLLAGILRGKKSIADFLQKHKGKVIFSCGWYLLLLLVFINGNMQRNRYLLPAYPLLAVLFASVLMKIRRDKKLSILSYRIFILILLLGSIGGAFFFLSGMIIHPSILAAGIFLLLISAALFYFVLAKKKLPIFPALGIYFLIIYSLTNIFVKPVFKVSPARELTQCIMNSAKKESGSIPVWSMDQDTRLNYKLFGQISVFSEGRINFHPLPSAKVSQKPVKPLILLTENYAQKMDLRDYLLKPCGFMPKSLTPKDIYDMLKNRSREPVFSRIKQTIYLAIKRE
jgi:4-amino-4-deoxy-L-arabinose transferase-like glycosyltransferase